MTLLVLADSYSMARHWALVHDIGQENVDWRYVDEPRHVRGRRGPGRYTVITNNDLSLKALAERVELRAYLETMGFEMVGLP